MKKFETPELEIVKLSLLDVITTSGGGSDPDPFPDNNGDNMIGWS